MDAQAVHQRVGEALPFGHHSPFPPIADYAFLSDCETTCLIAPSGAVEWMCLPRSDSPSIFGALLDRRAGSYRVAPYGVRVPDARRYLPGSLMLETTWQTRTGWLIVRHALCIGPWHDNDERSHTHRRTPTDYDAEHCLLRTIKCVNGSVDLEVACEPRFGYGLFNGQWEYDGQGYSSLIVNDPSSELRLHVTSSLKLGIEGPTAQARTRMVEGDEHFVALSWGSLEPPRTYADAAEKMWQTTEFWRNWITQGEFPDHPWRDKLQRSALTLKGLTYSPTGALLAAATTSLPETPGGERNWDYRYAWVRDSTFALWGLYTLGLDREANDFYAFIADACADDRDIQVLYGIGGEREITESTLDHLTGYEGARPVRVGNAAYSQKQHDVWGAVLDSVYLHAKSRDQLPESQWPILKRLVEDAVEHWKEPDRGIWEVRGEPQHFTSSKVFCWVALDRGARLARLREEIEYAEKWEQIAAEIKEDVLANGVDERDVFVQRYGSKALDASLLLVPLLRFLPADDKRVRATVLAIADELTYRGFVLRYKVDETDDGLSGEEGSFMICSFWLVSALIEIGEVDRGRALCERLLAHASSLGLYAEELDPVTGRHLGNFPQAFTHLALINAVVHVIRAEQREAGESTTAKFEPAHTPGS